MGHLGELHAKRSSQNISSGSESYNLQALASKPNKRQKNAILKLDQLVISHLTDYFSVWQLKTKLKAN